MRKFYHAVLEKASLGHNCRHIPLMAKSQVRGFTATLEKLRSGLGWVIVRVPFDVKKVWTNRVRLRVRGDINGYAFRTSLFVAREGGHILLVNRRMQQGAGVRAGHAARFRLEPDFDERTAEAPAPLKKFLGQDRRFRRWYEALSHSMRSEIAKWISDPKSATAQARRAEQIAERLMTTMDAERELPPILQAAFARSAKARAGWDSMTVTQRRRQLMAVFHYVSPESRARRISKILECAEERAVRGAAKSSAIEAIDA